METTLVSWTTLDKEKSHKKHKNPKIIGCFWPEHCATRNNWMCLLVVTSKD